MSLALDEAVPGIAQVAEAGGDLVAEGGVVGDVDRLQAQADIDVQAVEEAGDVAAALEVEAGMQGVDDGGGLLHRIEAILDLPFRDSQLCLRYLADRPVIEHHYLPERRNGLCCVPVRCRDPSRGPRHQPLLPTYPSCENALIWARTCSSIDFANDRAVSMAPNRSISCSR